MNRLSITTSQRLAGSVLRYHTWPTLQQQTVADHSFHVLRIYAAMFGPPPEEVTWYILWHDLGEIATGDIPFPVKSQNWELKDTLDNLERDACESMGKPETGLLTDHTQRRRIKICDLIEMHEFGRVEVAMGNTLAQPVVDDTYQAALDMAESDEVDAIIDYLDTGVGGLRV